MSATVSLNEGRLQPDAGADCPEELTALLAAHNHWVYEPEWVYHYLDVGLV